MTAIAEGTEPSACLQDVAPQLLSDLLLGVGEARIRVAGTSMLPSIRPADVLVVRSVDITRVERDDVILCRVGSQVRAHRVVRIEGQAAAFTLITRGDAHRHDDPPVTATQFLGRVVGQLRGGRVLATASGGWPVDGYRLTIGCRRLLGRAAKPFRRATYNPVDIGQR